MPCCEPITDIADERESIGGGGPGLVLDLVEQLGDVAALDAREFPPSPLGQDMVVG